MSARFPAAVRALALVLLRGPALQPNSAPLHLFLLKGLDAAAVPLGFLNLPPLAYYRLVAAAGGWAGAAGFLAVLPLLGRGKSAAAAAWKAAFAALSAAPLLLAGPGLARQAQALVEEARAGRVPAAERVLEDLRDEAVPEFLLRGRTRP